MREFRTILQTSKEPKDIHTLWYYKGILKYYDAGEWKPFNVVYPEDIAIKIDALPRVKNLKDAIDYLFEKTNNYKIVKDTVEFSKLKKNELNDGTHCYIIDNNKCFIYSEKLGEWVQEDNLKSFYLFTDKSIVTEFNSKTGYIKLKEDTYANAIMYIAFGDVSTVTDLNLCRLERVGEEWYLKDTNAGTPKVGQNVYIVATDRGNKYIPALEVEYTENDVPQACLKYYNNSIDSIFREPIDIIKAITTNTSNIKLLLEWKTSTDSHQTLQDAKIDRNTEYAQELNNKIDAKVIAAGGVAFDLEPTKDSNNAVFSGGVYKYIDEKFVVLTPEEYESLVIKNSNTFYFILE